MMRQEIRPLVFKFCSLLGIIFYVLLSAVSATEDTFVAKKAGPDEDARQSFKRWRLSAQEGHPKAQNALAKSYFHGVGTARDYKEALKWYEKVARQKDPGALQNMGHIYANGLGGVSVNLKKAFALYMKAATQGNVGGQYFVGHFFANGLGVEKDNVQALMWFDLVASKSRVPFNEFQSAGADALFFVNYLQSRMADDEIFLARKLRKEWKPSGE